MIVLIFLSLLPIGIIFLNYKYNLQNYQKYLLITLFILSLIPRFFFINYEPYTLQGLYDIPGHIDYVKYVVNFSSLPQPYQCWECYQQPLYYITATFVYKFALFFGNNSDLYLVAILQFFSLITFYLFAFAGIQIFKLTLNSRDLILASAILLFWPSGVIHSVRIGNDNFYYLIISLSLYFLISWWQKNTTPLPIKSIIFVLLGLITKTNAVVMVPVIVTCLFIKNRLSKQFIKLSIVMFLVMLPIMVFNQRYLITGGAQDNWLIGNFNGLPKEMLVGNKLENFVLFDLNSYLNYPNIIPGSDNGGRQYFWVYLLKTSLFGEMPITQPLQQNLAKIISVILLIFVLLFILGMFSFKKTTHKAYPPLYLSIFFFFSSLIIFRYFYPCPCSNDFRYIYPVLIPVIIFIVSSYKFFEKTLVTKYLYLSFMGYFILTSFLFHTIPYLNH